MEVPSSSQPAQSLQAVGLLVPDTGGRAGLEYEVNKVLMGRIFSNSPRHQLGGDRAKVYAQEPSSKLDSYFWVPNVETASGLVSPCSRASEHRAFPAAQQYGAPSSLRDSSRGLEPNLAPPQCAPGDLSQDSCGSSEIPTARIVSCRMPFPPQSHLPPFAHSNILSVSGSTG